eukprot:TRINITY_DN15716_c0_g1_i1.p1 TRINITY_DN15716_c0_g1~~TRINITY_DN15716_c0_g1_i1.p1  ORF type:complete len:101 (+),score=27.14 TRINITY_DN15716_c0_g1_i1:3-305(+)
MCIRDRYQRRVRGMFRFTRSLPSTRGYSTQNKQKFDASILDIVVCPLTKTKLRYDEKNQELISDKIGIAFPIQNGIPILAPHQARYLEESEKINKEKETS